VFGKDVTGLFGVTVHLVGQRSQILELFFVTQLGDELDIDVATVQVTLEIKQVRFQQRLEPKLETEGHGWSNTPWTQVA